jgi:flagellar motility protein MotE (MotC chaperone)
MKITLPVPRLLPLTMVAMALLLVVKSVALVRAAVPAEAAQAAVPTAAAPAAAAPVEADPARPDPTRDPVRPEPVPPQRLPPPEPRPREPMMSDSERSLLLDLRARRTELEAQSAALTTREAALSAAEQRVAGRVAELTDLQRRLEALEADRRAHDEANWHGLVKLYETMKPREAAAIFNDLDLPVLLPVLDRMKETKAAQVLAAMQPERARQVTAELAQLRTRAITPARPAPTEEKR